VSGHGLPGLSAAPLASVCREQVELNLEKRGRYGALGPSQIYVRVAGVDAYHDQIGRAGVPIRVPIADREYGVRDFGLEDPSGLDIGEPIEDLGR
jgi:hypothetical protein